MRIEESGTMVHFVRIRQHCQRYRTKLLWLFCSSSAFEHARFASDLQDSISYRRFRLSSRKTKAFLLFQICQQHRMIKALYWSSGTPLILWRQCRFEVCIIWSDWSPMDLQNSDAKGQWKMMWSGDSVSAPQIRQPRFPQSFFWISLICTESCLWWVTKGTSALN